MDKPKRQGAGVRSKDDNFVYDMDIVDDRLRLAGKALPLTGKERTGTIMTNG